jgi:capsular polysaccharide transport system permease protein
MTMKLKVNRFRTRRSDPVEAPEPVPAAKLSQPRLGDDAFFPDDSDDGFGNQNFTTAARPANRPAETPADRPAADPLGDVVKSMVQEQGGTEIARPLDDSPPHDLDAIRREGLTGRQLRLARRMAQKHGLPATSDFDAVRLLRNAGIDPFQRSAVLELVASSDSDDQLDAAASASADKALSSLPESRALTVPRGDASRLPQTVRPAPLPSTEVRVEQAHIAEVHRIQAGIIARRRRKLAMMWGKIAMFVLLPTFIAGWYFFMMATPMYTTKAEFVIQQSTSTSAISNMFTGTTFATSQDSVAVQGYLQSAEAMELLDKDKGFRAHFSDPAVDPIQRLEPDASNTEAYALYQRYVKISYDPTEGVVKMEVSAASPEKSVEFTRALIGFAENKVDQLTERLRGDQEENARASFADAQEKLFAAQRNLVELQEKYKTLNSEVEAGLITTQIGSLDAQLTQEKLSLAQMKSNSTPNKARMDPVIARIATLEEQIAILRQRLTEDSADGLSIASVQSQLMTAQADVATRQMMLAQATSALETSRIEASRQVRYLSLNADPVASDDPTYPRAFESTLVVMLIFAGIYLMISMTIAILREQVSG